MVPLTDDCVLRREGRGDAATAPVETAVTPITLMERFPARALSGQKLRTTKIIVVTADKI